MVIRSSYLCNGISYTGKLASLYWTSPPAICKVVNYRTKLVALYFSSKISMYLHCQVLNKLSERSQHFQLHWRPVHLERRCLGYLADTSHIGLILEIYVDVPSTTEVDYHILGWRQLFCTVLFPPEPWCILSLLWRTRHLVVQLRHIVEHVPHCAWTEQ